MSFAMFTPKKQNEELEKLSRLRDDLKNALNDIGTTKFLVFNETQNTAEVASLEGNIFDANSIMDKLETIEDWLTQSEELILKLADDEALQKFQTQLALAISNNPEQVAATYHETVLRGHKNNFTEHFPKLFNHARDVLNEYKKQLVNYELRLLQQIDSPQLPDIINRIQLQNKIGNLQETCLNKILDTALQSISSVSENK